MSYKSEVLADSPRHYWRLNEPFGASGARNLGSIKNPLMARPSYISNNGSLSSVEGFQSQLPAFGWSSPISDGGSLSMASSGLYKPWTSSNAADSAVNYSVPGSLEVIGFNNDPQGQFFVGWYNSALPTNQQQWQIHFRSTNISAQLQTLGNLVPSNVSDLSWHHAVLTWSNGSQILYIDGVSAASGSGALVNQDNPRDFLVGTAVDGTSLITGGFVSEIAVYNFQLSSGRVAAHYAAIDQLATEAFYIGSPVRATIAAPTSLASGTVHASLTGTGEISITSTYAIGVVLDTVPAYIGQAADDPAFYFDTGWITPLAGARANGEYRISRPSSIIILPPLTTAIGYAFASGVVASITEFAAVY